MDVKTFVILFIVVQTILDYSHGQQDKKFFRKDYQFFESTQSFYKYHKISRQWREAKRICEWEGASLFYPENKEEAIEIVKYVNDSKGYKDTFIGINDLLSTGFFYTFDGKSVLDVFHGWASSEPNNGGEVEHCLIIRNDVTLHDYVCEYTFPFFCKKPLASIEWNNECNVPYSDYFFYEEFKKCYKFHTKPLSWTDAQVACISEQSHLAVINSRREAELLVDITRRAPKKQRGTYIRGSIHLGFHSLLNEGWVTVKGTTLEESGYDSWGIEQPDGGDAEKCGSMFHNGRLNDIGCDMKSFFICEHDL